MFILLELKSHISCIIHIYQINNNHMNKDVMLVKKKKVPFFLGCCLVFAGLAYLFRPMTMNDIYDKPNFSGTVLDVRDNEIIVGVKEDEAEFKSSDKISVSLHTKVKDSMTDFKIGNQVKVFYDGTIAETYPAKISTVYAIVLTDE